MHGNQNRDASKPYCDQPRAEYGRFDESWNGDGTNDNQLAHWLDPNDTGNSTTNSLRSPSITVPNFICYSGHTVSMQNPPNTTITWDGENVSYPNGNTGTSVTVRASSSSFSGNDTITASFTVNNHLHEIAHPVWVGIPENGLSGAYIVGPSCIEKGSTNNYFHGSPHPMIIGGADWYNWSVHPYDANIVIRDNFWNVSAMVDVGYGTAAGFYTLRIKAENDCGENSGMAVAFFEVPFTYFGGGWYMSFTPNPTTGETVLTIESENKEEAFDETAEWELEVYSPAQTLKEKKTKLKGKSTTIQTHGWKEGVYVVRVKYRDEILTGKLVVKE